MPAGDLAPKQLVWANGNNQNNTFVVNPSVMERVTGPVTRVISIPMEWARMFVDGPNFGTTIHQVFNLFESLNKDDRVILYPIAEIMGMACCASDNRVEPHRDRLPPPLPNSKACLVNEARGLRYNSRPLPEDCHPGANPRRVARMWATWAPLW